MHASPKTREALGSIGSFLSFSEQGSFEKPLVIVDQVCFEYCTVMDYGGRLLLRLLCLLRLYVVVFSACRESPFTDSYGTISSSGFNTSQPYDDNLACTYRIMVPANRRVILEFKFLDILGIMPDCEEDSLEILVG